MNHDEIKKALDECGLSFTALAEASGRSYQSLTAVTKRSSTSKPAAKIIAAALGLDVSEVFPDVPQYAEPNKQKQKQASVSKARKLLEQAGIEAA